MKAILKNLISESDKWLSHVSGMAFGRQSRYSDPTTDLVWDLFLNPDADPSNGFIAPEGFGQFLERNQAG